MKKIFRYNGLSLVFGSLFLICWVFQTLTGYKENNLELEEKGVAALSVSQYLHSGHFIESTFENWESEFLQMAMFVALSAFLFQKGSSESNDPDHQEPDESVITIKKRLPKFLQNPLGIFLYGYSLSIAFFALFLICFILHWYGSMKDYNLEQHLKREPLAGFWKYLTNNRLWFESFQNWQSEFLAVLCMVVLSIFLRHKGSAQSKKLTDANSKTG
ncbi:MAG: DUF6766 family protein [Ginsengibacter sp.]